MSLFGHFEQIQGYASRCLLGSLCPLVCGAAEWFSTSGHVHDLHHAELCSRSTSEIVVFLLRLYLYRPAIKDRFIKLGK